jgi:TPR repeat protein
VAFTLYNGFMKARRRKYQMSADLAEAMFNVAWWMEEQGDRRTAFRCLLAGAAGGDFGCQLNLGVFYAEGTGVRRDLAKAAYWSRKAFRNPTVTPDSRSTAALNLAMDYRSAGNQQAARQWFEKAWAQKDGSAGVQLARMHAARRGGLPKAVALAREVLALDDEHATDFERAQAQTLLEKLAHD